MEDRWGRVAEDGTVYVRTGDGERAVGQWPDSDPAEALAFYKGRYEALHLEVELLEQRVRAGTLSPDDARTSVKQVRGSIAEAQVVGDLAGLSSRLDVLNLTIAERRQHRKVERARKVEDATAEKERIAAEAERLAQGNDWRGGANKLRDLLDAWKQLPRIDRKADDALWRQFSSARSTYTRRRKAHFAELDERRESARVVKTKLAAEAEELGGSKDWGPTTGKYRDLMRRWKEAGPAPKDVEDELWTRFRGAQDTFFTARDAVTAERDREFAANAEKKQALLAQAEALLPVGDVKTARESFREISQRWDAAGKVPREQMKDLEGRMRKVETTIRGIEDDQWRRSNPEARARAADTVAQLESSIQDLQDKHDKAAAAGDTKKVSEHAAAIEARKSWLTEAQKALTDFSG